MRQSLEVEFATACIKCKVRHEIFASLAKNVYNQNENQPVQHDSYLQVSPPGEGHVDQNCVICVLGAE